MDNLPETAQTQRYLDLLSAQLRALPPEVQAEQREEVRLHLAAMAAACRELGSGADAAEREALVQFGDPVQVGKDIVRRYWPSDVLPGTFWSACGTALFWMTVLQGAAFGVFFLVSNWLFSIGWNASLFSSPWNMVFQIASIFGAPAIAGIITGWTAPRYAVSAVLLSTLLLFGIIMGSRLGNLNLDWIKIMINLLGVNMAAGGLTALLVSRRLGRKRFILLDKLKPRKRVKQ